LQAAAAIDKAGRGSNATSGQITSKVEEEEGVGGSRRGGGHPRAEGGLAIQDSARTKPFEPVNSLILCHQNKNKELTSRQYRRDDFKISNLRSA